MNRLVPALATAALLVGGAQAAPVTTDGATFTLTLGADTLTVGAIGDAEMTDAGGVRFAAAESNSLLSGTDFGGTEVGTGVTLSTADGAVVALTDFVIEDGVMFGRITARGVDGSDGLLMYGTTALFEIEDANEGFDLRLDGAAGAVLSEVLGMDMGGKVVAQLQAAPSATPIPGALLLFATGAGALIARRRIAKA